MNIKNSITDVHALEARLAAQFASRLSTGIETLPHDVTERLRFAREQALARAREARLQSAPAPASPTVVAVSPRGVAVFGGFVPWWQRAASVLPLVVLVAGFLMIEEWSVREQVLAAADIDARLLADDLPPAAYSDPGFAEFLIAGQAP
ncbi:conserved hypothetical protein [Rubrivivax sp. A210]|uniref:DUF3619 family protein n=1 Tax=Rubrivivax sp. A210 TaxID=2772301 RepID=UPI00191A57D9|nr:DUF3619 family protein [Rubrivivax sp. A210]CAD5374718.1 conserved hypothetical protein [Rubrivivax sp. A210]